MKSKADVLQKKIEGRKGSFSIMARDFATGEELALNADAMMPTASVFKVPILVELFRQASRGKVNLDQVHTLSEKDKSPGSGILKDMSAGLTISVRDLATLMIIISDNTAADLCLDLVGCDNVNATMKSLGLSNTKVAMGCKGLLAHCAGVTCDWPDPDTLKGVFEKLSSGAVDYSSIVFQGSVGNNITSARDMVNLLEGLYKETILDPEVCRGCLGVMRRQQLRERIPRNLPLGTITMTKSGTLGQRVINDVGIVAPKEGHPYAIAILTNAEPTEDSVFLPAILSRVVYDYFCGE